MNCCSPLSNGSHLARKKYPIFSLTTVLTKKYHIKLTKKTLCLSLNPYNVGLYCVLSVTVKEGTPEDDDLEGLAEEIVAEWIELGRRLLKNHEANLYAIDKENEKYSDKAYKMLLKWKRAKGSGATFHVLHKALCHRLVNRRDLAEKFCLVDHD